MREIKFRAWSGKQKLMFYLSEHYLNRYFMEIDNQSWGIFDKETCETHGAICNKHYQGDVLMQYTGLKDKNGKEIYEGDIVKFQADTENGVFEVIFQNCCFIANWSVRNNFMDLQTSMMYLQCSKELEVIGNIYEKPELLEAKA